MLEFKPNCMELMLEVAREIKPDISAKVYFTSAIPWNGESNEAVGCTVFPDDGSVPHIQIHTGCTIEGSCEVLAHELAHVIVGTDAEPDEHGPKWKAMFDMIYATWAEKMEINYEIEMVKG